MSRLSRGSFWAVMAASLPLLATCAPAPAPSGGTVGASSQAAVPASQPPASQPSPQLCVLRKPDGGNCVSLQQLPMEPAQTDQGYATKVTWILTNECSYPMQVGWGWTEGQTVGETVLAQGQSTQASCLWNIDGCTGSIDWVYRCSQVR